LKGIAYQPIYMNSKSFLIFFKKKNYQDIKNISINVFCCNSSHVHAAVGSWFRPPK